ncbi:MAG: hypothetical protein ACLGPM_04785 [Acidobacteriota bacterium]
MRRLLLTAGVAALLAIPSMLAAQAKYDHGEVEAYGDMFRVTPTGHSATNYLGLGGRVSFNTGRFVALEAEMNYDFEQNYTNVTASGGNAGGTSTTITSGVRPITALFGPKFQLGSTGPFRAFLEAKAGFIDFSTTCNAPAGSGSCFTNSLNNFGGSSTHFAAYPGGGIEAFWGPLGVRVDAGDELYFNNGTYNNLRVTFGPTLRF